MVRNQDVTVCDFQVADFICKFKKVGCCVTISAHRLNFSIEPFCQSKIVFKADRLQMIVVAKNLSVLQLFISRMPKMCAILQLVSAPLNPIPIAEHFRRSRPQCEHSYGQHIYMSKENNAK